MIVGQATPTEGTPMEVDSENPIPNLNSQSDSGSRVAMEGVTQQDTATAEMVVQAQETLLRSRCLTSLSLSLPPSLSLSHPLPLSPSPNLNYFCSTNPEPMPGVLQLSPAPGEKDYFFHLDDHEGVLDLYDIKKPTTTALSSPSVTSTP